MKKSILIFNVFMFSGLVSMAQYWGVQSLGLPGAARGVTDISIVDANTVWVICYDGSGSNMNVLDFSRTTDGGVTWTAGLLGSDTTFAFSNISAVSDSEAWVCTYDNITQLRGALWHTMDRGITWNQSGTGVIFVSNSFPNFVHFKDQNNGFALGDPNSGYFEIYTTVNSGATWTRTPQVNTPTPLSGEFCIVNDFTVSGDTIWAGTNKGRILRSVDYGLNWTAVVVAAITRTVSDIAFTDHNNGLAVLYSGTTTVTYYLFKTVNGGTSWTQVTPVSGNWFKENIANIPGTSYYMSSSQNVTPPTAAGSSFSINAGSNWTTLDISVQRGELEFFDAITGWCGDFSDAIISTDGGILKWSVGPVGINPPALVKAETSAFPNPSNGLVTLKFKNNGMEEIQLTLVNSIGELIFQETIKNTFLLNKSFDFSHLPKGIYMMNLQNGSERITEKLIIQ